MAPRHGKYGRPGANEPPDKPPDLSIRYFYHSPLHIDKELAIVPSPTSNAASASGHGVRPFSDYDNGALERAWNLLRPTASRHAREDAPANCISTRSSPERPPSSTSSVRGEFYGQDGTRVRNHYSHKAPTEALAPSMLLAPSASQLQQEQVKQNVGGMENGDGQPPKEGHYEVKEEGTGVHGLAGKPFLRVPAKQGTGNAVHQPLPGSVEAGSSEDARNHEQEQEDESNVIVGMARIYQVSLPNLTLEPVYWNAVHDKYPVVRGTWFYEDMLPVEADIANLLERGYLERRPWTETWSDELNSAIEVGALGEEKIAYTLWPELAAKEVRPNRPLSPHAADAVAQEATPETQRKHLIDAARNFIDECSGSETDTKAAGAGFTVKRTTPQLYLRASVIYANAREATILRPSLAPSAYYGRRPYANYIRKGFRIGVPVFRGFDTLRFEKLDSKKNKPYKEAQIPQIAVGSTPERANVTDLILVIHGIGQKLSERVESFHFTHAMNAFRREINVELHDPSVRKHMRRDMGGIMVLPVNWRSTLSFDDGGYEDEAADASHNRFSLKDITPHTLSSIRNIVSDVMLDIPYYLSHHQPKIISAVVGEANRIYRLWCKHNPGFEQRGTVHLIAHSLGSVIATDILSSQPSKIDPLVHTDNTETDNFAFDTKNLYLCGSPVGFFLLLRKATLIPRRGRKNSLPEDEDGLLGALDSETTYGCLAVDNIYNIVNPYDPVAYHLNAAIDAEFAASLKTAYAPTSSDSWFSFKKIFGGSTGASATAQERPPPAIQRLPSSVELETHNFTKEELAEKRAYLLNDNGQVDFSLRYGGGPLEIQYLTMLSAHSSYWVSHDFIRLVVLETARSRGRGGTLETMRAVKKRSYSGRG